MARTLPSTPNDWYRRGEEALGQQRWDAAEQALWECLALQPRHGAALHLLARVRQQQGRDQDAIRLQRESVACDPGIGWNSFALAELLEEQGDWPAAAAAMAAAAAALPEQLWIAQRQQRLAGRATIAGERLADGLGPAAYRHWCQQLEPPLARGSAPATTTADSLLKDWHLLLAGDARLRDGALAWVAEELLLRSAAGEAPPDGIYADEDRLNGQAERHDPWFKPGWQPEAFWSTPWLDGFSLWRRDWLESAGLPPPPAPIDPSARFSWQLQALAARPRLLALPRILVHRSGGAGCADPHLRANQLHQHLRHLGEAVTAVIPQVIPQSLPGQPEESGFRFSWALPPAPPLVSVIVPSRDRPDLLAACLDGLLRSRNSRINLALWVVDNGSRLQASADLQRRWGEQPGLRGTWLDGDGPFNWSLLNNRAALEARGELLLFLNNDVQLCAASGRSGSWLESLAAQALRPAVATAGALLLTPEGKIQHAGIVPGLGSDGCAHPYRNLPPGHGVHRGRSSFLSAWPALTGACLMVRRLLFLEAGGFDPALPVEGNDVDFGLRLGARGFRQVLCPDAVLMHAEGSSRRSRGDDQPTRHAGLNLLRQRWPQQLAGPGPYWPAACSPLHPDGRPRELAIPGLD